MLKSMYKPYYDTLIEFIGGQVQVEGTVTLHVMLGSQPCIRSVKVNYFIVSAHGSAYNAILGRPSLNKVGVIISTLHLLMKFLTN